MEFVSIKDSLLLILTVAIDGAMFVSNVCPYVSLFVVDCKKIDKIDLCMSYLTDQYFFFTKMHFDRFVYTYKNIHLMSYLLVNFKHLFSSHLIFSNKNIKCFACLHGENSGT